MRTVNRLAAFTLVASLGNASAAFAGEGILASATRIVREAARSETRAQNLAPAKSQPVNASQQAPAAIAASGMSKRTKLLIYLAAGVGFVTTAYAIDHRVQDITPSSLGTRED